MAEPHSQRVTPIRKYARESNVQESRAAINFINFPLGGRGGSVTFAPRATRPALTLAPLRAIRAA